MNKYLLAFLIFCPFALGQGTFVSPQMALKTVNGLTQPMAGATITVCPPNSAGIPCTPATVSIYSDSALAQPLSNPFTADANGNFIFALPVTTPMATVTVTGAGFSGYSYQVMRGGSVTPTYPVEAFGAVGDWNGSTGTDNTTAIQLCLNTIANGVCLLQGKGYKISGALTINRSGVGISGAASYFLANSFWSNPTNLTQLISTSASADIIDIVGSVAPSTLYNNSVRYLGLARTVAPSGTAKGLSVVNTYGTQVDSVVSVDSIYPFYFNGVGSSQTGYIENCEAGWGFGTVTETSGAMIGFFLDSSTVQNPSIRIRNSGTSSNLPHSGSYSMVGLSANGASTNDLHINHFETASVDTGININQTSGVFFGSSDIHLVDVINDGCLQYCIKINGVGGAVQITGGWDTCNVGCVDNIDIESSSNVTAVNVGMYAYTAVPNFLAHNSTNITLADSSTYGISATPIVFNGVTTGHISNVTVTGAAGATGITMTGSTSIPITGTILSNGGGGMTVGISIDAASHGITGLESDLCTTGVTTCISDAGGNFISIPLPPNASGAAAGITGTGACSTLSTQTGAGWSGSIKCTGGTAASTIVITPGGTATNGWACSGSDYTAGTVAAQSGLSATTCTLKFASVATNDFVSFTLNRF